MTLAKVLLRLGALVLAIVGIGFLAVPVQWAAIVDIQLPTATARTDLRATYGGFDLAHRLAHRRRRVALLGGPSNRRSRRIASTRPRVAPA